MRAKRTVVDRPAELSDDERAPLEGAILRQLDDREITLLHRIVQDNRVRRERERAIERALAEPEMLSPERIRQIERTRIAKRRLAEEFGLFTSAEIARLRASSTRNPSNQTSKWVQAGRIVSVDYAGGTRFPGFQFDEAGSPLPAVGPVIQQLRGAGFTDWQIAMWFVRSHPELDGDRPADDVTTHPDQVVEAARFTSDQTEW